MRERWFLITEECLKSVINVVKECTKQKKWNINYYNPNWQTKWQMDRSRTRKKAKLGKNKNNWSNISRDKQIAYEAVFIFKYGVHLSRSQSWYSKYTYSLLSLGLGNLGWFHNMSTLDEWFNTEYMYQLYNENRTPSSMITRLSLLTINPGHRAANYLRTVLMFRKKTYFVFRCTHLGLEFGMMSFLESFTYKLYQLVLWYVYKLIYFNIFNKCIKAY